MTPDIEEAVALLQKALNYLPNNNWRGNPYREIVEFLRTVEVLRTTRMNFLQKMVLNDVVTP